MKKRIPTPSELLAEGSKVEPLVLSARRQVQFNRTTSPGRRLLLLRSRSAATELEKKVQDALWQTELAYGFATNSLATPAGAKELEKAAMFLQSAAFKLRKVGKLLKQV